MNTLVLLCLLLLPIQQQINDQGIPLVFGPRAEDVEIVPLSAAQVEYRRLSAVRTLSEVQKRRLAALEIALGTAITNEVDKESLTVQEVERFRFHRRGLQAIR